MNLIKNATVYRASLPGVAELAAHLAELPFVPVLETMQSSAGFIPHPTTEKLVTEFPGGLAFRLRQDIKPISLRAINLEHDQQINAKAKELGRELSKEEVDEIKVAILTDTVKSTLPERIELDAFYHIDSRTLILPTSNKNMASTLLHKLVLACAAIETSTIHVSDVKGGLTTRLRDHFDGSEEGAFNGFKIGDSVVMKGEKGRASFDLDNLDHAKSGVLEALAGSMQVERLELCHADVVNFKLTKDFQLRGITYIAGEDDELPNFESLGEMWTHNASVQVLLLSATVQALCDLFGYQEKANGNPESNDQEDLLDETDPLYTQAVAFVRESNRASISSVQRKLLIGYNRAARLIEAMEMAGVVTSMNTNGQREVIRHG